MIFVVETEPVFVCFNIIENKGKQKFNIYLKYVKC